MMHGFAVVSRAFDAAPWIGGGILTLAFAIWTSEFFVSLIRDGFGLGTLTIAGTLIFALYGVFTVLWLVATGVVQA